MSREYFSLPLTEQEEYWAGLIHADGSISKTRDRLTFGQKDLHPVREFLKFFCQDTKVTDLSRPNHLGYQVGYAASTTKGVQNLRRLGVKMSPAQELYSSRHFWRGLIDGDGSVIINGAGKPVVILSTNKSEDIQAFSKWVGALLDYEGPRPYQNLNGVWLAGVKSGRARALGVYLYESAYSALPRKQDVALSFRGLDLRTKVPLVGEKPLEERHVGVCVDKRTGKFWARLTSGGVTRNLGGYATFREAKSAYLDAKSRLINTGTPNTGSFHSGD